MKFLLILTVFLFNMNAYAQLSTFSFEEVDSLQKQSPRPVVIFIHTDWCKFCKIMENNILQDELIIDQLNSRFYFVSFNAEDRRDILFREHIFKFKPNGQGTGQHELALQLGSIQGKLSFPSICILNDKYEIIFQYDQLMGKEDLAEVLQGVGK